MNDQPQLTDASEDKSANDETDNNSFTIIAGLPYRFGDPMCCSNYSAEIWRDAEDTTFVTFTHSPDCEVWRFVP